MNYKLLEQTKIANFSSFHQIIISKIHISI